ncbi:hypothetical protein ABTW96_13125 [Nocardia beijingensis]|uniref:hypothetical protein n=1 Tax=Nocardia beijingensis TaxID=95162 RepID=UPI003333E0DE
MGGHARAVTMSKDGRPFLQPRHFAVQVHEGAGGVRDELFALEAGPVDRSNYHAGEHARLLGTKVPTSPSTDGIKARDTHGALRTLLRVVAAMEASLQPTKEQPDYYRRVNSLMGDYMRFLAALGYPLAPIERLLTEELTTAQVLGEDSIPTTSGDRHRPDEESDEPADSGESDATPADAPIRAEDVAEVDTADHYDVDPSVPAAA